MLKTLKSRVLIVLVTWLALSHLAGLWLYARQHEAAASLLQDTLLADRIALTAQLLEQASPADRRALLAKLTSPLVKVARLDTADQMPPMGEGTRPHHFEHLVALFLDRPSHDGLKIEYRPVSRDKPAQTLQAMFSATLNPGPHHLPAGTLDEIRSVGTVTSEIGLRDGATIAFTTPLLTVDPFSPAKFWGPLLALLCSVLVSGAWMMTRATTPLVDLANAAERLGTDIHATPLPERGAIEVRAAARAFNVMQERIQRLLEDRSAFAAALAHDIGTPITRLVLRMEELPESDTRTKIASDIDQMRRMIQSTLNFARSEFEAEPSERVNLSILVQSIVDDMADMGASVGIVGTTQVNLMSKPVALRRAIANVVENAVKYGGRASIAVTAQSEGSTVSITVDDDGPGIPPALHEDAFRPFRRLGSGAETEPAGSGLGLSVARSVARTLGGEVALSNLPTGGLRVTITLPRRAA